MSSLLDAAQEEMKPDMTPMIDCVFLMIIFFICIDFKVLEAKLPAYLPKDKGSQSTTVEPQEQLSLGVYEDSKGTRIYPGGGGPGLVNSQTKRPYRAALQGHTTKWMVGPTLVTNRDDLLTQLKRIYNNRDTWQDDKEKPGQKKPMPVVIEPHPGTYYDDAAKTADVVKAAGFTEINFGGGLGAAPGAKK
ncbi:MAG: biopolymer transporter ExbD [Planctomycetota bacterium]